MLHLDSKRLGRIEGGPGHRITGKRERRPKAGWEWMHVAIDDHSRAAYVEMLEADDGPTAKHSSSGRRSGSRNRA
jgi:hypothetical protein